jgi:hypothetical protein
VLRSGYVLFSRLSMKRFRVFVRRFSLGKAFQRMGGAQQRITASDPPATKDMYFDPMEDRSTVTPRSELPDSIHVGPGRLLWPAVAPRTRTTTMTAVMDCRAWLSPAVRAAPG